MMSFEELSPEEQMLTIRKTLRFLMESEKKRQEEVEALKEQIGGVDTYCKKYVDDQEYSDWKDDYGDKLDPYSEKFAVIKDNPDYDFTRETYDAYKAMSDEELKNTPKEDFVEMMTKKADDTIALLKEKLGIPEDSKVEITQDENGNTEVKADVNGDGTTEPVENAEANAEDTEKTDSTDNATEPTENTEAKDEEQDEIEKAVNAQLEKK